MRWASAILGVVYAFAMSSVLMAQDAPYPSTPCG